MKRMLVLAAALLLLLTGCAASGGEPEPFTLFYTAPFYADDDTIPFYPVATPAVGGGTLLRTDAGDRDEAENLYLWKDGTVTRYEAPGLLNGLTRAGEGYYYWDDGGGIWQYEPETAVSTPVFSLDAGTAPARFWGKDGILYCIGTGDYTVYRYDTGTGESQRFDWLSDCTEEETWVFLYGVIGDELLVAVQRKADVTCFWLNMLDGSRRYDDFPGTFVGYRDGAAAFYRRDAGEILFRDLQSGAESALPVPEAVLNDRNGDYRLLGVTEENIYWLYRQAICVQKGEELETAYSFRPVNPMIEPAWQYYQLIGGVLYFAYYGEPKEEEWLHDIALEDPNRSENRVIRYCALMPDGEAYILAKEYRENVAA